MQWPRKAAELPSDAPAWLVRRQILSGMDIAKNARAPKRPAPWLRCATFLDFALSKTTILPASNCRAIFTITPI